MFATHLSLRTQAVMWMILSLLLSVSPAPGGESEAEDAMPSTAGEVFDHSDWTTVLQRFVDDDGMVDYQALARDRAVFDRYLESVRASSPSATPRLFPRREHALAFYINAYNAHVFGGVLDRGPETESVWSGLISGLNFFSRMKIVVGGERTNLKKLEEKVILAEFEDARVHAAINCASISCPRLRRHAYTAAELDRQLDDAMREWVGDPRHLRVDRASRTVYMNKIFDWFSGDFLRDARRRGVSDPTQIDYVNFFRQDDERIPRDFEIEFMDYDKGINAQ